MTIGPADKRTGIEGSRKEAEMTGSRFAVEVGIMTLLAASVAAQRTTRGAARPLTNAQLQAKVRSLEDENASLQRDYDKLRAFCQDAGVRVDQPPPDSGPSPNQAAPVTKEAQSGPGAPVVKRRAPRNVEDDLWRIVAIDYGVTESSQQSMRFGWKVTISNGLDHAETFDLTVQFLDKNGLVVETSREEHQTIRASDQQTLTGDVIIRMPAALGVASAKAIANRRR
jgi:hypothetical protein